MPLITLKNLSLSFGSPPLLDEINLHIDVNERVCLLGRNGAGKSTLLKLINGEIQADEGSITIPPGIRIAKLSQEVPSDLQGTINEVVADGLAKAGKLLHRYYHLLHEITLGANEKLLEQLGEAAEGTDNLMPHLIDCVENSVTLGEICQVLRGLWGEYQGTLAI